MSTVRSAPAGAIQVGQRVRYTGTPDMSTWNRPYIGATARITNTETITSRWTETSYELLTIEFEVKGKTNSAPMQTRIDQVQPIAEDAPAQGEQSLTGDCSYVNMLTRANIDMQDVVAYQQSLPA